MNKMQMAKLQMRQNKQRIVFKSMQFYYAYLNLCPFEFMLVVVIVYSTRMG